MQYELILTGKFKKSLKLAKKRGLDITLLDDIVTMLHNCPEPYREVLYQRIFGNLSFREIGEVLGKSENWARVTYYRGKQQLKERMMKNEN